ncbi:MULTISPECIES: protein-L-isoaspartate(D-aspartate) O-methyltransferase [unclassified Sphingomonas]|uniref:protein-L-isoaspartate(D-aspartate) O-methyltransferase n=1 Tax=unclassified Sphingomonas TaxID=196159 RepID=UPI00092ACE75|nr:MULTISPECIES: protein-L-isoaspartate(D-aspartate) O-methyltransferase [unclassified Sphingomonas]OJU16222.1 MAG: protein-L-isoaspartate O-methyltransferase [Sphingomonas sp. 66-10]
MPTTATSRNFMVDSQIAARGIADEAVLAAMREVPRERFVPAPLAEFAYEDTPLPIEAGQTISQPYIVAHMIEAAQIGAGDHVLEIGAGSGYAAAILSRIAGQVHAIERHAELAALARERMTALDYRNVEIRVGDGTAGWPEQAPFDAILVAAGGPTLPPPLCRQLKIGGRLVMPVGDSARQRLIRVTRCGADDFAEEDLGDVQFVPLIGAYGWALDKGSDALVEQPAKPALADLIRDAAEPLPEIDNPAFGAAFDRYADARIVLIGEASHGTSEFYRARAAITKWLIERHGFTIVAVEADWPDAAALDRHVRHKPAQPAAGPAFRRFPTWMWRNTDVDAFIAWLRAYNAGLPTERMAGFYGLDLYNMSGSIRAVIDYLDRVDPASAAIARERYGCLTPWGADPAAYGRMALDEGFARCEEAVVTMLRDLFAKQRAYLAGDPDAFLDAAQNARLIANAENYYRVMYHGAAESWNLRDTHMFDTLELLLAAKGPDAKAVVWAHNSHIGDARFTEMGQARGELNIGQLCREHHGEAARLIGLGTHRGTVAAARDWDAPMEIKTVNPSRPDSYERQCHDSGVARFLLDLREGTHPALDEQLTTPRLERFIGVIYRPDTERWSHYSSAILPRQFDAWLWFDTTSAVTPLPTTPRPGAEETYPFGV